jgi:hypothetical protein
VLRFVVACLLGGALVGVPAGALLGDSFVGRLAASTATVAATLLILSLLRRRFPG